MNNPMMKCGHAAQGYHLKNDGTRESACIICGCMEIAKEKPDLTGRMAKCSYYGQSVGRHNETYFPKLMKGNCCGSLVPSDSNLPFFKSDPTKPYDEFYCGCFGWD